MKLVLLLALLLLSSCATPSTMMVNPDNGEAANCATMGWGLLGAITASEAHRSCVEAMKSIGWVTVDEYKQGVR